MVDKDSLFDAWAKRIKEKYDELEYKNGWRFLYGPQATLSPSTPIVFAGINPGGLADEKAEGFTLPSQERGNAYRRDVEQWEGRGIVLQREVCALFHRLADVLRGDWGDVNILMRDKVLTSNFCPFRSKHWKTLPRKREAIEFSNGLWKAILPCLNPSLVICMGNDAHTHMREVLRQLGCSCTSESLCLSTGWGAQKYQICYAKSDEGAQSIMIVKIPHLSSVQVMTRRKEHADELVKRMAAWITGNP